MIFSVRQKIVALLGVSSAVALGIQNNAQAADATAQALQVVTAALRISHVSDLDFGSGIQGDAAKTVAPGTAEDASNASFDLTGEPSRAYTITLPADGVVAMSTAGGGAANKLINVTGFSSFPSGTGSIDSLGAGKLFVGASRDALLANQVTGSYAATFTATVVY